MFKKSLILLFCLFSFWAKEPLHAQVVMSDTSIGYTRPDFYKKFLDFFKKKKKKVKAKKLSTKEEIAEMKMNQKALEDMIKKLSPQLDASVADTAAPGAVKGSTQKLREFSLHAIEESKFLSVFDSKNYYRTERQWGEFVGREKNPAEVPMIKRDHGKNTIYGFHPFWMGLNYYQYNFELYDRVAYYGYSVDASTGTSSTFYPGQSFKSSQIVRKASERSAGKCKIDLAVTSYGLGKNTLLFSEGWETRISALTDEVTQLVNGAGAGGICLDFQQVATGDSTKFVRMVKMFHDKLESMGQGRFQITMILPSFSQHFPYTINGRDFLELWQYVDRFVVMGYSSYAALYNPEKDSLAAGVNHDVLWNILLVDDGINHYSMLTQDVPEGPVSPEKIITDKLLLSLPACEIKLLSRDSLQVVKYSDLKLLKLDEGFLPSFQEKLAYATSKELQGVALWGMGYDNGTGGKDLQNLLAAYSFGTAKQDGGLLDAMEKLIDENKALGISMAEFFPVSDAEAFENSIPLPDVLRVDLPSPQTPGYTTRFDKEAIIIQHVVVLCLIIFLFFAIIGVIISLFFDSVRESILTKDNALFLFTFFSLIGLVVLLKKVAVINNTIFLFSLGILLGSVIPYIIRKRQAKAQREDRP